MPDPIALPALKRRGFGADHAKLAWCGQDPCSRFNFMPPDSPPAAVPAPRISAATSQPPPGVVALFFAFAKMSLAGFGGALAFARRGIVDEHRWMTADEFNETYALCHFLPGPNVVNLSVVFGARFRGVIGGIAAFAGLIGPPMVIVTIVGALYMRYGEIDALRRILTGVTCGAIGLLIAAVFRMMLPLLKRRDIAALAIMVLVFVAIGLVRLPLQIVLVAMIPISIAVTFMMRLRST